MREVPIPAHITILFVEQEVRLLTTRVIFEQIVKSSFKIVGDDTTALESVLKADVWRDHLLKEEAILNAKLAELEKEGDDKRFEDAREEASSRMAEVHARLSDMDAESGPSRAATLLAGTFFDVRRISLTIQISFLQGLGSLRLISQNRLNHSPEVGGVH
jgi:ATP-binding cassette subfamily F protein 3